MHLLGSEHEEAQMNSSFYMNTTLLPQKSEGICRKVPVESRLPWIARTTLIVLQSVRIHTDSKKCMFISMFKKGKKVSNFVPVSLGPDVRKIHRTVLPTGAGESYSCSP